MPPSPATSSRRDLNGELAACLGLGLAVTAWFFLQQPNFFDGYDFQQMHEAAKSYYRAALLSGRLPLWNPHPHLGRPFLADIETATLYPPNLLFLLGPRAGALVAVALHQAWAAFWARRWAQQAGLRGAAAWVLPLGCLLTTGFALHLASGQLQVYFTLCHGPALLVAAARLQDQPGGRAILFATAMGTLALLAGSPPFLWVLGIGGAVYWCLRRPGWKSSLGLVAAGALTAGLGAAQLLPFFELVGEGNRLGRADALALAQSMDLPMLLTLVHPSLPASGFDWERHAHLGVLATAAALLALATGWRHQERRALAGVVIAGGLLAASSLTPVLPWLVAHVPGFAAVRFPCRYWVLGAAGLLAASAWPVEWLRQKYPARGALLAWLVLAGMAAEWIGSTGGIAPHAAAGRIPNQEAAVHALLPQIRAAASDPVAPPRVLGGPGQVRPNAGMMLGFSSISGFANPVLARVWFFLHLSAGLRPDPTDPVHLPIELLNREFDFAGLSPAAFVRPDGVFLPIQNGSRAWVTNRIVPVHDAAEAMLAAVKAQGAPAILFVEQPAAGSPPATVPGSWPAALVRYEPERIFIRLPGQAGLLALAEPWYPGWQARVDGRPAPILPVNGWMRGVAVAASDRTVEFVFAPASFRIGLIITGATLALVLGLAWRTTRRSAPPPPG